ncbi:MAG: TPM domain-containing protein [Gammaproteobacteria bacterium]
MLSRLWRHLLTTRAAAERAFPPATLAAIEQAIVASERRHAAEIRFVLEPALAWHEVRDGLAPRARALQLFAELGVWDTAANNGVLIHVLYADHAIEIVADRGFASVTPAIWREICASAEAEFRAARFEAGSLALIERVGTLAAELFPPTDGGSDELPNTPLWL